MNTLGRAYLFLLTVGLGLFLSACTTKAENDNTITQKTDIPENAPDTITLVTPSDGPPGMVWIPIPTLSTEVMKALHIKLKWMVSG